MFKECKKIGKYVIVHSHSPGTNYSLRHVIYQILSYNTRNIADYFSGCSKIVDIDMGKITSNPEQF